MENCGSKYYQCGRISSEFMDCSFPLTADVYNYCLYNCQYCFAINQKVNNPAYKQSTFMFKSTNPQTVINEIMGKTKSPYYENFYKHRFPLHFGGLSDPFEVNLEKKFNAMLPVLQYLVDIEYPTLFSTKGTFMAKDDKFLKCFEKAKKSRCLAFQFSIIGNEDDLVKKVELNCPSTTERLETMKILSDMGYWCILRLRPFIIGISDINLESLLERAKDAGARAISLEFMCSDMRSFPKLRKFYDIISKTIGFDVMDYYKKLSPTSRGTYLRLNTLAKEPFMRRIIIKCKELGLHIAVSDPDYKWLNFSGSCCFGNQTKIWIKQQKILFNNYKYGLLSFTQLSHLKNKNIKTYINGSWIKAKFIKIPYNKQWYYITLKNGKTITTTEDHIHFTQRGKVKSKNLLYTDMLLFNNAKVTTTNVGNYDAGKIIGWYLGDGYINKNRNTINFYFDKDEDKFLEYIQKYCNIQGYFTKIINKNTYKILNVYSKTFVIFLKTFTRGNKANNKSLNEKIIYNMSDEFRRGIIDGWEEADGKHSKNTNIKIIMTVSEKLATNMFYLAISIGLFPIYKKCKVKLRKGSYFTKLKYYYIITLTHPIDEENLAARLNSFTYKRIRGNTYVKINMIQKPKKLKMKEAFCLYIPTLHKFILGNGIITHNCGMPRTKQDYNSELVGWSRGQLTYHLIELRKRYWASNGKDKYLKLEEVIKDMANNWGDEIKYFHDYIKYWNSNYRMARQGFKDAFLETWNNVRSPSNPYRYFDGIMKPSSVDENTGNLIFEYNPCESELRLKKEGIIE